MQDFDGMRLQFGRDGPHEQRTAIPILSAQTPPTPGAPELAVLPSGVEDQLALSSNGLLPIS